MFEDIFGHLNATNSLSNEHHVLYKLRAMMDRVLPLLFPNAVFGIDWLDKIHRKALLDMHRERIKAAIIKSG